MAFFYRIFTTIILFLCVLINSSTLAQAPSAKGNFYFSWGYNREAYSKSTIRFRNTTTDNYDFTFIDAKARDEPDMDEFYKITHLTIPQYQMNAGYFFKNKNGWGIEVSWDHLKYFVIDDQVIHVQGQFRGHQIDKDTLVTPSFVHLQHTNGNNYLMVNVVKKWRISQGKHLSLDVVTKAGAGPLVTYTISTILGNFDKGHFHPQGWVAGLTGGLKLNIYQHFFIQTDGQGAYADYTGSELGADHVGRATHHFISGAFMYRFGVNIPL